MYKPDEQIKGRGLTYTLRDLRRRFQDGELEVRLAEGELPWVTAKEVLQNDDFKVSTTKFKWFHIGAPGVPHMRMERGAVRFELRERVN